MIKRSTWILLGVFGILLAMTWILQRSENAEETEPESTLPEEFFLNITTGDVVAIRVEDQLGMRVDVQRENGENWLLDWPVQGTADPLQITSFLQQSSALRIETSLETRPSLADLGLDTPAYKVVISLADDEQFVVKIGDLTPTGSGFYAQLEDGDPVVVAQEDVNPLLAWLSNPPIQATESTVPGPIVTLQP